MTTPRIVSDPNVLAGKPVIAGTRNEPEGGDAESADALGEAVQVWVARNQASEVFRQFRQLLATGFPPETQFAFTLESDPDAAEDSLVCAATLPPGHPVQALACYKQFVAKWARLADPRLGGLFTLLVRQPDK